MSRIAEHTGETICAAADTDSARDRDNALTLLARYRPTIPGNWPTFDADISRTIFAMQHRLPVTTKYGAVFIPVSYFVESSTGDLWLRAWSLTRRGYIVIAAITACGIVPLELPTETEIGAIRRVPVNCSGRQFA